MSRPLSSGAEALLNKEVPVLDHGFVQAIDYMGTDEDIVQAARVSYGPSTKPKSDDRGLLRYLMNHRHCYAPWMQVLTARGWKRWDECSEVEDFLVPDPDSRSYRIERLVVDRFDADEELVTFSSQRMSFAVTPDHRMYFRGKYRDSFEIVRAEGMPRWGHFDPLVGYALPGNQESCLEAEMLGFYLGDGSHSSRNTITFHLRKPRKRAYLERLLAELGWVFCSTPSSTYPDAVVYCVHPPVQFFTKIHGVGARSADKAAAEEVFFSLSLSEKRGVFRGLTNSDGHLSQSRPAQICFSTSSPVLATQFETLGSQLGFDVHRNRPQSGVLVLTAYSAETRTSLEARAQYFGRAHFQGQVYCATTSTGLLAVRGASTEFGFVCGNTTPYEMCEVKFRMKMPIFVARQIIRTRTANVNEMSLRYTEAPDEFYLPRLENISLQSTTNKQGRSTTLSPEAAQSVREWLATGSEAAYKIYEDLAEELGIARELARTILPVSLYTQWIWKIDLHNLLRFLGLRLDEHAQWETRQYAQAMASFVQAWVPLAWEAFEDYMLYGMTLSRHEVLILQKALQGQEISPTDLEPLSKRELAALRKKFPMLRLSE